MLNHNSVLIGFSFCSKMPKIYNPKEEIFIWGHFFPPLVTCPVVFKYVARQHAMVGRTFWKYLLCYHLWAKESEEKERSSISISRAFASISSSTPHFFNVFLSACSDSGCTLRLQAHESASHLNISEWTTWHRRVPYQIVKLYRFP